MSLESDIVAWLESLLSTELFPDPAGGTSVPLVKEGATDPKRSGAENEEDFPFVVVRTTGGAAGSRESSTEIQIIGGAWTGGDVQSGFDLIKRLNELLLTIAGSRGVFFPWRLSEPSHWYYGYSSEDDKGKQPYPYYFVTISLSFTRTGGC